MVKNHIYYGIIIFFIFCFIPYYFLYAQRISSKELISKSESFDGKEIIYQGEIIGERMCREKGCWLNVKDGDFAIGVWIPSEIKFIPKYTGSYKYQGDEIEIRGIFHRNCKEHLGEIDIHAQKVVLIKEGKEIEHTVGIVKKNLVIFIWGILCLVLILMRLKKI